MQRFSEDFNTLLSDGADELHELNQKLDVSEQPDLIYWEVQQIMLKQMINLTNYSINHMKINEDMTMFRTNKAMDLTETLPIDNDVLEKLHEWYSNTQNTDLKSLKFSSVEKEKVLQFIETLDESQWELMKSKPNEIAYLSLDGEVFAAFLKKVIKEFKTPLQHFVAQKYFNGNSLLHCLSKDPLTETQMEIIMYVLQEDTIKVDGKNKDNKTFLDISPVHNKLLQQIQISTDKWAKKMFEVFRDNPKVIERWILLGNDSLLEALFYRLLKSFSSLPTTVNEIKFLSLKKKLRCIIN